MLLTKLLFNSLSIACWFGLITIAQLAALQQQQQEAITTSDRNGYGDKDGGVGDQPTLLVTTNVSSPSSAHNNVGDGATFIDDTQQKLQQVGADNGILDDASSIEEEKEQVPLLVTTRQQHDQQQQATLSRNGFNQPLQQQFMSTLDKEVVERLIKQWAPIVWLAPEEKFLPLGVEEFLNHVHPMDKEKSFTPGVPFSEYSTKSYLVTNTQVDDLLDDEDSFLHGRNPNESRVPIYGVVTLCNNQPQKQQQTSTNAAAEGEQQKFLRKKSLARPIETSMAQTSSGSSSTRSPPPYIPIPISIDPQDERNNTIRRSSRLYPVFQRIKRDIEATPTNGDSTAAGLELEYMPYPPNYALPTASAILDNNGNNNQAVTTASPLPTIETIGSSFIANLADNVKFSMDDDDDGNLQSNNVNEPTNTQLNRKVPSFHVTYWMFYPYSQGKTMCTLSLGPLGRIPFPAVYGYCLGKRKDIGSHIGDWEHMSLYFNGAAEPEAMYVSAHDAGAYYSYNRLTGSFEFKRQETRKGILQRPNFPKTVTTFNDHPVLFAAKGSHGLWTAPGKHRFVKVARLYDINGFGTPWNTWKAVEISYENLKSYGRSLVPDWLTYRGKWGNPKSRCHPFKRIGLNFCEFADGPTGIPLKEPHFECGATYR